MRVALPLPLALLLACAHSPAPAPGPRPLGNDVNLARTDAALELRFRYEAAADRSVALLVDLHALGPGSMGPVKLAVVGENFVVEGDASWSGEVPADTRATRSFLLRARADGVARATLEYSTSAAQERVQFGFVIEPDGARPCQPADAVCRAP